jgi:hypothetical protein
MRAAKPDELREHALPVLTAQVSEIELRRWFPFPFQEITEPWTTAEPSKGALLQLKTSQYFVLYWGYDSQQLTVRIAPEVDATDFLSDFLHEVPLPQSRISWSREGVALPAPMRSVAPAANR